MGPRTEVVLETCRPLARCPVCGDNPIVVTEDGASAAERVGESQAQ